MAAGCGSPTSNGNASVKNNTKPTASPASSNTIPMYTVEVVKTYPHDPLAFTQGLIFLNGFLYEGTGGKPPNDGFKTSIRKVELTTGKVLQKFDVAPEYFGEGITVMGDKLYQLTWTEGTGFIYNLSDFKLLREVRYSGDGWGLTNDGTNLIMSDGTHVIRFVEPETFKTVRTIVVNDEHGKPLMKLNELEFVNGEIWANIWETPWIVRIDPQTGKLLGRIDLSKMVDEQMKASPNADVLNGIAYDEAGDRLFVTGKLWKNLFEIKLVPKEPQK